MDPAIVEPTAAPTPRGFTPNTFELSNRRITVSFSATSITGQPLLHFKDRHHEVNARGEEILQTETEIGTLVTITLEPDADAGALLFTLVLPRAILTTQGVELPLATQGLYTRSRQLPRLPASVQLQTTDVVELKGTATFVVS